MAKKIVKLTINDEHIVGSGVSIGAAGSHDETLLQCTFSDLWDGTSKRVYWRNALGEDAAVTVVTPYMVEYGNEVRYLIPVAAEAKQYAGMAGVTLKGFKVDEETGEETEAVVTETAYFRVSQAYGGVPERAALTPTEAEQLQSYIDRFYEEFKYGGDGIRSNDFRYMRINRNGYLELSNDNAVWYPAYAEGGGEGNTIELTATIEDDDVSEEQIEELKYVTRELNPRIKDYKRIRIENSLHELELEGGEANAKRIAVCVEALKYATDVEMCPYKWPSSVYIRTGNLYDLTTKQVNADGTVTMEYHKMSDSVALGQDNVQQGYNPTGTNINYLREVIGNNPCITGADCSGGIVGIMHKCNVLGTNDEGNPIDIASRHFNMLNTDSVKHAVPVTIDELKPGDTVGWDGHVGLYVGGRYPESYVGNEYIPASPGWIVEWRSIECGCQLTQLGGKILFNFRTQEFFERTKTWEIFARPKAYGDWIADVDSGWVDMPEYYG